MNQKNILNELRDWTGWAMGFIALILSLLVDGKKISEMEVTEFSTSFFIGLLAVALAWILRVIVRKEMSKTLQRQKVESNNPSINTKLEQLEKELFVKSYIYDYLGRSLVRVLAQNDKSDTKYTNSLYQATQHEIGRKYPNISVSERDKLLQRNWNIT